MTTAVLLPGYGGSADQPILLRLSKRLEAQGIECVRFAPSGGRPSEGFERELAELHARCASVKGRLVLVGRSFGGRICARFALKRAVAAMVILAYPIRPPGKKRLDDEVALGLLSSPTLIIQGDRDELGPLAVLRAIERITPALSLYVVKGASHSYGKHEKAALDLAAAWIGEVLGEPFPRSRPLKRRRAPPAGASW